MGQVDLNLLLALDALLAEGGVTGAARRLGLSSSAMSRTLARLRSATGDPLLVRAGRGLVPTPYAAELRERVHALNRDVLAVLRPHVSRLDIASLERTFTIRANEGFVAAVSASLVAAVTKAAPRVRLRFAPKPEKDARALREGQIDLEIGVLGAFAPEVRSAVFISRQIRWRGSDWASACFRGQTSRPNDMRLAVMLLRHGKGNSPDQLTTPWRSLGSDGRCPLSCRDFLMRCGSLVTRIWSRSCRARASAIAWTNDPAATAGLQSFELPVRTPEIVISAMWHPRVDADPAHRWLRDTVVSVCRTAYPRLVKARRSRRGI